MANKTLRARPRQNQEMGICALCLQHRKLCESHIVPEFAYQAIYDDKHRLITFSPADFDGRYFEQKGLRERLLCLECESHLNTCYENPFKLYWVDRNPLQQLAGQELVVLNDVDYATFKLFHLSVLWRASVCSHDAFYRVDLGPHNEIIRKMLLERNPGPDSRYPIVCVAICNEDRKVNQNLIASPIQLRFESHIGYVFTFCGCQWLYLVSSHRSDLFERLMLTEAGKLPVGTRDVMTVFRSYRRAVTSESTEF